MFEGIVIFTGWAFWIAVAAFVVLEILAVENESWSLSIVIAIVAVVLFSAASDRSPMNWIIAHPLLTVALIPAYFALGALWSLWKWRMVVAHAVERYKEILKRDSRAERSTYAPSVGQNRDRITSWIIGWPFSLVWSLLSLPRQLAAEIYRRLTKVFQRMVDKEFA